MEEKFLFIIVGVIISLLLFFILYLPNRRTINNAKKVINNYLDNINSDINLSTNKVLDEKMDNYKNLITFYRTNPNTLTRYQGKIFLEKLKEIRNKNPQFKDILK